METLIGASILAFLDFIQWYHWLLLAIVIILIVIKKKQAG